MLTSVCLVPSTPLLVPGVAGGAAAETEPLRSQVVSAVAGMAAVSDRWFVVGAGEAGDAASSGRLERYPEESAVGTFLGFGPDVRVALSARGDEALGAGGVAGPATPGGGSVMPGAQVALPLLIAGWLRSVVGPDDRPRGKLTGLRAGCDAAPQECLRAGRALRSGFDGQPGVRTGVLVVADGPTTMTDKAPGAFDERARPVADAVAAALGSADVAALGGLDQQLCAGVGADGRAAWQVAAGLVGDDRVRAAGFWCDWPYGVFYPCGLWLLDGRDAGRGAGASAAPPARSGADADALR